MPLLAHGRWSSRLARVAAVFLLLVIVLGVAGWFFGGPYAAGVIRTKLQTLVAQQLNARLEIGRIRYRWPYGVQADDVALFSTTPDEPSIRLAAFDRLDLQFAKFPLRSGPLVIERIDVTRPTLYVVETKAGFTGLERLLRHPEEKAKDPQHPPKLSDVLRLRHVQLSDARVEYDDRTISKSVPFVWDKLNLSLDAIRHDKNPASYHFETGAGNGDSAKVRVVADIDLDTLVLNLQTVDLTARLVHGQRDSPLPAGVQHVLNTLNVAGTGHAMVRGVVPLLKARELDLNGEFHIDDAEGKLSAEGGTPLSDLDIGGKLGMKGRTVTVDVALFSCRRGPTAVSIQPTTVTYKLDGDRWSTTPIRAAFAYAPPADATGVLRQRLTIQAKVDLTELAARDQFRANVSGTTLVLPDTAGELSLDGTVRYDDSGIALEALQIDGLGGPVIVKGLINETATAVAGEVNLRGVELDRLNHIAEPGTTRTLQGKLYGHLAGAATDNLDAVRGEGRFRVTGGKFAKVPILGGIAERLHVGQKAFVAHEATGHFALDTGKLTFDRFAISTDVLSVRGTGDIGYDGKLALSVYADGVWRADTSGRAKKDELYIPVLSDIGRAIAGVGAYTFGSVSRQFTHFTVTGTVEQPKFTPSPAPVLSESLERAFHRE